MVLSQHATKADPLIEASILCARHPGTEATFTCSRCGSFGCELCRSSDGVLLCLPCQAALEPAALHGGVDLAALLKGTFQQIAEHFRGWILIVASWSLLSWLFWNFLAPHIGALQQDEQGSEVGARLLATLLGSLLGLLLNASIIRWMADGIWGSTSHSVGAALWAGLSNFPRMAALWVLTTGGTLMGCVALVIPGLIMATCWYLAPIAVMLDRTPITESLGRSFELTSERRWLVFFLLILETGLGLGIYALDQVTVALPALPDTASLVLDLMSTLLNSMCVAAFETLGVLLYLRLTRRR
jgi:hypothetical protein